MIPVVGATSRRDDCQPVYNTMTIVRCRRCRTYINPYVEFVDNQHWRCNMCYLLNEGSIDRSRPTTRLTL
jgi:hypothetical protein